MIRKANSADLTGIMKIVQDAIAEMHCQHNTQWDQSYPQESDFASDIAQGELYAAEQEGKLAGFICINREEPKEYAGVSWSRRCPALVMHRMAVDLSSRRQGIGTELINYAADLARFARIDYIKTDTYSLNGNMQGLLQKCGYQFVGTMNLCGKENPFYCYEKTLSMY